MLYNHPHHSSPELCHLPLLKLCSHETLTPQPFPQLLGTPILPSNCGRGPQFMENCGLHQFSLTETESYSICPFVYCCCSVTKLGPILCYPKDCSTPGFPVLRYLLEFAQTHVHWVGDTIQPPHTLLPHLLLPSIFPSLRVFSNESALYIRWPKYCSFSFSIRLSNVYSGLISFRIDWFDLAQIIVHLVCFLSSLPIVTHYWCCQSS